MSYLVKKTVGVIIAQTERRSITIVMQTRFPLFFHAFGTVSETHILRMIMKSLITMNTLPEKR